MTNEESLRQMADRINSEKDNAKEATDALLELVKRRKAYREFAMWYGCNRLIHDSRHKNRHPLEDDGPRERAANANTTTTKPRISAKDQLEVSEWYTRKSLLESYFVGDKRLGDCLKGDLASQIERHESTINGYRNENRFLSKVLKKLPNESTKVREVFDADSIERLKRG